MKSHARLRSAIIVLVTLLVLGCETTGPPHQTAPSVDIPKATRKTVLDLLVSDLTSRGAQLRSVNEYVAVFDRPDESMTAMIFFGSRYNPTPNMRLTFTTVSHATGTRVFARAHMVTNPNSSHERLNDVTSGKVSADLQSALDRLKIRLTAN